MSFYRAAADGLRLRLKVKPQARRDTIDGVVPDVEGEVLVVSVTPPPEDGKANAAVIALLAKTWGVQRNAITIAHGATARRKLIAIAGDAAALAATIEAWRSALNLPPEGEGGAQRRKGDAATGATVDQLNRADQPSPFRPSGTFPLRGKARRSTAA